MKSMERLPVAVIGGGPAGLSAALALGLQNIPVILLEGEPGLTRDLRAGSYHPPTLEMLSALGIGEALHARGIIVPDWQIRDRVEGVVAQFDLSLLKDETPYPYRLHLEQHQLTPLLLNRIQQAAPSVEVRFSQKVTSFDQDNDRVILHIEGHPDQLASFVIGADGARSAIRRSMEIEFEGFTWPERFVVASTTYDLGAVGFSGAGYIADPEHWAAVFHVPDSGPPGIWRLAYPSDPEVPDEEALAPESVQQRLHTILEYTKADPPGGTFEIRYVSSYRVHQRVAKNFVKGRAVLVGDAAHVNNPLGGMGLNCSIHDAVNLAAKLGDIWYRGADHEIEFDRYNRQRRTVNIKAVQAMSIRNKRLLEERDVKVRHERLDELRALVADPVRTKQYLMDTSMINSVREAARIQ